MKKMMYGFPVVFFLILFGCSTSYKAKPLSFKMPAAYHNMQTVENVQVAAKAFNDPEEAKEAFGFDIRKAGMLPVQVVFENQGNYSIEIDPQQTFLEDVNGNLWPILSSDMAYERATKYSQTGNIVKEGAYHGVLGAAAGSIIGAAIGIVTGDNVLKSAGKGAAVGAAAGTTMGGMKGYDSDDPQRRITRDLREKSLNNVAIAPKSIANGFIFFPGEASTGSILRLRLVVKETQKAHLLLFSF